MARPQFKVTPALKRKVAISAGGGMSHEEIAITLGISRNTLEKHFALELSTAAYQKRFEVLDSLHKAAKKGSVAACKEYLKQIPAAAAPPAEPEEKPKGKKEQAAQEAQKAAVGTDWNDLLNPPNTVQ